MLAIGVLGPLTVSVDDRPVDLTSPKLRAMLVVLAMQAGSPVPADRLAAALWDGDDLPDNTRRSVQTYVARLRSQLGGEMITTELAGYQLSGDRVHVDALEFNQLLDLAAQAPDVCTEQRHLAEALALWRGSPFDGVPSAWLEGVRAPLVERYLAAVERGIDLDLADGRHGDLVVRLQELTTSHPLRESLWVRLLTALDRSGRQAEALTWYETIRRRLADELGVDPGPELRQLYADLLVGRPPQQRQQVSAPAPDAMVPRQLPADVQGFTGRTDALKALHALVADRDQPAQNAVVISAIAGMAGIGKTALAVHWAHQVVGDFDDGQLYVNLHGYAHAGSPVEPLQALAGLLRALGVAPGEIPADVEQAAALYRSLVAGRRMLVMLDNASSAEQVRPLLPGSPTCVVLITSRDRLSGLVATHGAQRLTLDVLTSDEALALLGRALGADRVAAELEAARELAETCAYLPLALRIAAANLVGQPGQTIAGHLAELNAGDRLGGLAVAGEPQVAVHVAFDASYRRLAPTTRRVFRLLGCVPGPEMSVETTAAMAEVPPETAARLLDKLAGANLVEQRGVGRFGLHDLLRHYAREQVDQEDGPAERAAALTRLFDCYLHNADVAAGLLYPEMVRLPVPESTSRHAVTFDSDAQAMAWLDTERTNLVAAVRYAADNGFRPAAWLIADALRGYFWLRRFSTDWLVTANTALAAATDAGDTRAEASARLNLGNAYHALVRHREAIENYTIAHELAGEAGWTSGQAAGLGNLGALHSERGNPQEAAAYHARALPLFRQIGRLGGQANTLLNLGVLLSSLGRLHEAVDHHVRALALYRELGSRNGQAFAFDNLGEVHRELGNLDTAYRHLTRAVPILRELGDRNGHTQSVRGLAMVLRDLGRHPEALEFAESALALAGEIRDPYTEAKVRNTLASVQLARKRPDQAAEGYRRALDLAREIGTPIAEATAELGLASVDQFSGRYADAADHARRALALAAPIGLQVLAGQAHTTLADALRSLEQHSQALGHAQQALQMQRETGHRPGEARTLRVLGSTARDTGDPDLAGRYWRESLDLYTDIGSPEADEVRALLNS